MDFITSLQLDGVTSCWGLLYCLSQKLTDSKGVDIQLVSMNEFYFHTLPLYTYQRKSIHFLYDFLSSVSQGTIRACTGQDARYTIQGLQFHWLRWKPEHLKVICTSLGTMYELHISSWVWHKKCFLTEAAVLITDAQCNHEQIALIQISNIFIYLICMLSQLLTYFFFAKVKKQGHLETAKMRKQQRNNARNISSPWSCF